MIATWAAIAVSLFLGLFGIYQNTGTKTQEIILEKNQKKELFEIISAKKINHKDSAIKPTIGISKNSCGKSSENNKK